MTLIICSQIFHLFGDFSFIFNESKPSTVWATLTFWVMNVASTATILTDYHAISFRVEDPLIHFNPPDTLLTVQVIKLQLSFLSRRPGRPYCILGDQKLCSFQSQLFLFLMFGTCPILINSRFSKITWSTSSPQIKHFHPQKDSK